MSWIHRCSFLSLCSFLIEQIDSKYSRFLRPQLTLFSRRKLHREIIYSKRSSPCIGTDILTVDWNTVRTTRKCSNLSDSYATPASLVMYISFKFIFVYGTNLIRNIPTFFSQNLRSGSRQKNSIPSETR